MGSCWFICEEKGRNPNEAFERARNRAVTEALTEHATFWSNENRERASRGEEPVREPDPDYTYAGNILTKTEFVLICIPPGVSLDDYLESLDYHEPWDEKWGGVAACIVAQAHEDGEMTYRFFGSAPC